MKFNLRARLTAEFLGSAFLVAAVIGSGIMGERLSGGNVAIALLANTIATGAALVALILTFGPISGAHFNPAVTLADAIEHGIPWPEAVAYMFVQCAGGVAGAIIAHLMFGLHWYSISLTYPAWVGASSERVRGDVRAFVRDLGMFAIALRSRAVRCCELHHRRLLVHCVNIVCEPGSDNRSLLVRHVCWYSAVRRSVVYSGADCGRVMCDLPVSLASPEPVDICRSGSSASFLCS
jgi:Major intrinsic protein